VLEDREKKRLASFKRMTDLTNKMRKILPPADPPEIRGQQAVNPRLLTRDEAAELLRLALEMRAVRDEFDNV
jgi:hypothetical protein